MESASRVARVVAFIVVPATGCTLFASVDGLESDPKAEPPAEDAGQARVDRTDEPRVFDARQENGDAMTEAGASQAINPNADFDVAGPGCGPSFRASNLTLTRVAGENGAGSACMVCLATEGSGTFFTTPIATMTGSYSAFARYRLTAPPVDSQLNLVLGTREPARRLEARLPNLTTWTDGVLYMDPSDASTEEVELGITLSYQPFCVVIDRLSLALSR